MRGRTATSRISGTSSFVRILLTHGAHHGEVLRCTDVILKLERAARMHKDMGVQHDCHHYRQHTYVSSGTAACQCWQRPGRLVESGRWQLSLQRCRATPTLAAPAASTLASLAPFLAVCLHLPADARSEPFSFDNFEQVILHRHGVQTNDACSTMGTGRRRKKQTQQHDDGEASSAMGRPYPANSHSELHLLEGPCTGYRKLGLPGLEFPAISPASGAAPALRPAWPVDDR